MGPQQVPDPVCQTGVPAARLGDVRVPLVRGQPADHVQDPRLADVVVRQAPLEARESVEGRQVDRTGPEAAADRCTQDHATAS